MNPEHGNNPESESGDIIRLNEAARALLEQKHGEYMGRYMRDTEPKNQYDTIYKIELTKNLLDNGKIDVFAVQQKLEETYHELDLETFDNAVDVIEKYNAAPERENL